LNDISLENTEGSITIISLDGSNDCTFDEINGTIDVTVGNGASHVFVLTNTDISVSITMGGGDYVLIGLVTV
jgi:hypothetical protein